MARPIHATRAALRRSARPNWAARSTTHGSPAVPFTAIEVLCGAVVVALRTMLRHWALRQIKKHAFSFLTAPLHFAPLKGLALPP